MKNNLEEKFLNNGYVILNNVIDKNLIKKSKNIITNSLNNHINKKKLKNKSLEKLF